MSREDRRLGGAEIARKLQALMDRSFEGRVGLISDRPEGAPESTLAAAEHEKIGVFRTEDGEDAVLLTRILGKEGVEIWLFSSDILARVPELYDQLRMNSLEQRLPQRLVDTYWLGSPVWLWIGMVVLVPVALAIAWLVLLLVLAPRRFWDKYRREELLPPKWWQVPAPWWFVLAVFIHRIAVVAMGIPLLYRFYYGRFITVLIDFGIAWVAWQVISWATLRIQKRATMRGRAVTTSFLVLGQRVVKVMLVLIAAIVILADLGINTTTAMAGVGIGGIAVAFASQKTLENLFGGASVLSDQTIRVGDTIRVGQLQGVVEDVSLRATRLRTLERTQLSIPNGTLATMNVDNLTARDKMFFNATLGLRYETTADQLRFVLAEIRKLLYSHPNVEPGTARVRFVALAESSLDGDFQLRPDP
jgi:MscS family membrane protein